MTPNVIPAFETGMDERSTLAPQPGQRFIRFGPFQLDQHRQELTKNGSRLKLQGKVYQVLVTLAGRPGEVVTREELRQRLWPAGTHVNYDANVNTTVNKLRQVLGDSTEKPAYIETIPRKGYSMVARLEFSEVSYVMAQQDSPAEPPSSDAMPLARAAQQEQTQARSGFWMPIGVAGLVLAGMLLGAGLTIATLWLSHFAQTTLWP